jgi:hypothetical protein
MLTEDLDALPSGKSVRLDDELAEMPQVTLEPIHRREHLIRDVAGKPELGQELPREGLARFKLRQALGWANARDPEVLEPVDDASGERVLRTDHRKVRLHLAREVDDLGRVVGLALPELDGFTPQPRVAVVAHRIDARPAGLESLREAVGPSILAQKKNLDHIRLLVRNFATSGV